MLGLAVLLILNSVALWQGTKGSFFEADGKAAKCYVMTREGVRFGERAGIDALTGRPCRPVTAELMDRLSAYAHGRRPERIASAEPDFFSLTTGEPIVWYAKNKNKNSQIELFNLMGYHPETGEELLPVDKAVVSEWRTEQLAVAERAPQEISDPKSYVFFDPKTGSARAWYWIGPENTYEFFDNKGFQPRTGDPLKIVTRDVLQTWASQDSKKCFIVTQETIRFGNKPGLDPETGRQCRPYTPALMERLKAYEKGLRPKPITGGNINFFDLRTGEPNIWYSQDSKGQIRLFDLIGFDPDSGQELLPITRAVVGDWKQQVAAVSQKPPTLVDPDRYPFFNTVSGKPQVWFWRGADGQWEFYDNAGFRKTGEKLTLVSEEAIERWHREGAARVRQIAEQAAQAERQRVAAQAAAQRAQEQEAARQIALQQAAAAKEEEEQQAGDRCDRMAANPTDARRPSDVPGVEYTDLKVNPQEAINICSEAVRVNPSELRYKYNLARALEFTAPQKAINI